MDFHHHGHAIGGQRITTRRIEKPTFHHQLIGAGHGQPLWFGDGPVLQEGVGSPDFSHARSITDMDPARIVPCGLGPNEDRSTFSGQHVKRVHTNGHAFTLRHHSVWLQKPQPHRAQRESSTFGGGVPKGSAAGQPLDGRRTDIVPLWTSQPQRRILNAAQPHNPQTQWGVGLIGKVQFGEGKQIAVSRRTRRRQNGAWSLQQQRWAAAVQRNLPQPTISADGRI